MGDVVFHRPDRAPAPGVSRAEIVVQSPPQLPRPTPQPVLTRVLPIVMLVAVAGSVVVMVRGGGLGASPMALMFPVMMAVSTLGMVASSFGGSARAAETDEHRKDYLRHIGRTRVELRENAERQRAAATWSMPDPADLATVVAEGRLWERRRGDDDALRARIGVGPQLLAAPLRTPEIGPVDDLEPVSVVHMRRLVHAHRLVPDLPVALDLPAFAAVSVDGDVAEVRAWARAVLVGLCALHGPEDLHVAVAAGDRDARAAWEWLKWLPHHEHPEYTDGAGHVRMSEFSLGGVEAMLAADLDARAAFGSAAEPDTCAHLVVVVDGVSGQHAGTVLTAGGLAGVTVLEICGSRGGAVRRLALDRGLCLELDDGRLREVGANTPGPLARADALGPAEAEHLAMTIGRHRMPTPDVAAAAAGAAGRGLPELLGLGPVDALDPAVAWRPRTHRDRLRVPVGVTPDGAPMVLDLKESAQGGMGPHGLCIGATGSGKSEFLRTLVLGLVASHDPEALNLVLVDFKGGATFLGLDRLAHVSAVITNLQAELSMVDRMRDALEGELRRRQELLRAAGGFASVTEYEAARARGQDLEPLPALVVVVDEFSELLSAKPEFSDLFLTIGRLGRSLHIHLLLASQRLEEGRLRGLDSHLSYRVALKTFSAGESRSVLGVTDAYHLPPQPGAGYLKVDAGDPVRFDAAYVSGPLHAARPTRRAVAAGPAAPTTRLFTSWYMPVPLPRPTVAPVTPVAPTDDRSLLVHLVDRLAGHGRPAHRVWLEPLGSGTTVGVLVAEAEGSPAGASPLVVPLGQVDRPMDQRRDTLTVDLGGAGGHVAIVGGSRAGKTTTVQSLVLAAAAQTPPDRLWFYCLDLAGGLAPLADLPHVGHVAPRGEPDRVRRVIRHVVGVVRAREARFRADGLTSVEQARARVVDRGHGPVAEYPDVVLVVDGWHVLRSEYDDLEAVVTALAGDGLGVGVHVLVTSTRWADLRPALRDALGTRIELRLGDPGDSMIDRRRAQQVPVGAPGRGLTEDGHHFLVAQPRLDGQTDTATLADAGVAAVDRLRVDAAQRYGTSRAEPVRLLPESVPYAALAPMLRGPAVQDGGAIPFGIEESELRVAYLDLDRDPLVLALGAPGSGKTSLVRSLARSLVATRDADRTKLVLVDHRRSLLGEFDGDHLAGYAANATTLGPIVDHLVAVLAERMPGPEVTPTQIRDRSWWSGPELVLLVDDLDLVVSSAGNPLTPLVPFLPHARDLGFAMVLTRRVAGASRAAFDPVLTAMRDLGAVGLLFSGDPQEGALLGGERPRELVPGRAVWITRDAGSVLVQTALAEGVDQR